MSGSAASRYVEVPPTVLGAVGESPLRRPSSLGTAQRKHPRSGQPSSLVQYKSITDTPPKPSVVAKAALDNLFALQQEDNRTKYAQLCYEFCEYLERCEEKGFMVKGYDTAKGKVINLPMSYDNRWGPVRRRELSQKLDRLEFWFDMQQDRPVTMLTLTSYHPDDETVADSWKKLNDSRTKLLKMIRKYCGDVDYFWVPEPHPSSDSGYVHYHIAVFADIPVDLENKLRNLWSQKYKTGSHTYGLDFSKNKDKDRKIKHLKDYLSKYLRKGFLVDEWSIGLLIFNATLWDTGFRMYGASKRVRQMMNIKDDKDNQIVWLETKMTTLEYTPENEPVQIEKVIWYRQYIPDWIDSDFWLDAKGNVRITDPPKTFIYDWGRKTREGNQNAPTYPKVVNVTDEYLREQRRVRAAQSNEWDDS